MPIPAYCACLRSSVLSKSLDAYVGYLQRQQYRPAVIRIYLRGVEHFARWVTRRRVPLRSIDESLTHQFLTEHLPAVAIDEHFVQAQMKHLQPALQSPPRAHLDASYPGQENPA